MPVTPGICRMFDSGIGSSAPNQRKVMCIDGLGESLRSRARSARRASVAHDEVINGTRAMFVAGPQNGRRKSRLVRRVREVLRLEGETGAVAMRYAALSRDRAVEEVAR